MALGAGHPPPPSSRDAHVPAWPGSPTLLLCHCPSFLWERMFDIQAISSSILDVSFHGSVSHRSDRSLLTFIPRLFVLAAPPVLLTGQNQAKAASPTHTGRGAIYHPSASQQDARLRPGAGPEGECPPSVSLSLPELWGKCWGKDFTHNLLDKLWSKIYEENW